MKNCLTREDFKMKLKEISPPTPICPNCHNGRIFLERIMIRVAENEELPSPKIFRCPNCKARFEEVEE